MSAQKGGWEEQDEMVAGMLARLGQAEPKRDPALAFDARQRFLEEGARIRLETGQIAGAAVSAQRKARHTEWIIFNFLKKENLRMSTLVTILVVVSLAMGGTGATVYAAQTSLPGDVLYGVKLAGEAVESGITVREESRLQLALRLSDERVQEMARLSKGGKDVPEGLGERWQFQVERALGLSAGMRDLDMETALEQVRDHLREQARQMDGLPADDPVQERVRAMIRERLELVEHGLADPAGFRNRIHHAVDGEQGSPWTTGTPTPSSGYGPGPGRTGTATPGSGFGPGTGDCANCTPEGERHPWTTGTPTPGSGFGPVHEPEHEHTLQAPGPGTGDGQHHDDLGSPNGGSGTGAGSSGGTGEGEHHDDTSGFGSGGEGEHHEESGGGGGGHH